MTILTRFLKLFLLLLFITLAPVHAQSVAQSLTITHLEATAEENGELRVAALISILDDTGQPISDAASALLSVSENSQPVDSQLLTIAAAETPLDIIFLVNTSSQMAANGPNNIRAIDAAKDAVISFIDQLDQDDQVAIYEFNRGIELQQALTYDHNQAIDQGVVELDAREEEAACLNDSLLQVIDRVVTPTGPPQVIITLTGPPGGELCNVTPLEDVLEAATAVGSSIPIFTIAFGDNLNNEALLRLGQGSKGRTLLAEDSVSLAENLTLIQSQLNNLIQISYPSQGAPGLATVIVFEDNAQLSDREQVLIPEAIEPTPTPFPQFSIDVTIGESNGDTLPVLVDNPDNVDLVQTTLYVNDNLIDTNDTPPFDSFELSVNGLGSGTHIIRVEASDVNAISASAQVELRLAVPPTPVPTASPTATPTGAIAPAAATGSESSAATTSLLPLGFICIGTTLLLALAGFIVYLLMTRSKQPASTPHATPEPIRPSPPAPIISSNIGSADNVDNAETLMQMPVNPKPNVVPTVGTAARLIVISGEALLEQTEYTLKEEKTTIGRKREENDIVITDPEVSRFHAAITRQGQQYFVQDLDSTLGTQLNGGTLNGGAARPLHQDDEIAIGKRVIFKFTMASASDNSETLIELNVDALRAKFDDQDPFRTQYDD